MSLRVQRSPLAFPQGSGTTQSQGFCDYFTSLSLRTLLYETLRVACFHEVVRVPPLAVRNDKHLAGLDITRLGGQDAIGVNLT